MLRKLLAGSKIKIKGFGEDCERGYKFRGELAIGNLISGAATNTSDWRGPNGIRALVGHLTFQILGRAFRLGSLRHRCVGEHRWKADGPRVFGKRERSGDPEY
jgi:hypothetical protein